MPNKYYKLLIFSQIDNTGEISSRFVWKKKKSVTKKKYENCLFFSQIGKIAKVRPSFAEKVKLEKNRTKQLKKIRNFSFVLEKSSSEKIEEKFLVDFHSMASEHQLNSTLRTMLHFSLKAHP